MVKSLHLRNIAGNIDLKGKKGYLLSCGCCRIVDLRNKYRDTETKKEILEGILDIENGGSESAG